MPSIEKLPSGTWRCRVFDYSEKSPDGKIKRHYKTFTSSEPGRKGKKECELAAAEWLKQRDALKVNNYSSITFSDALESYISSKVNVLSESTIQGYRTAQKNYYGPINRYRLEDLNKIILQRWVNDLSKTHSPKTVSNAFGLVSSVMKLFMDRSVSVRLPQRKAPMAYVPPKEDVQRVIDLASGDMKIAIGLGAYGGLRRGEICALTPSDVLSNGVVVNKSMVLTEDRTWKTKLPKTQSSTRAVQLPPFLVSQIKTIETERLVMLSPDRVTETFADLVKKAGVKHFRFHDLRHFFVSSGHSIGIPDQYLMQQGGWQTDRCMKAVYRGTIGTENEKFAAMLAEHFESNNNG